GIPTQSGKITIDLQKPPPEHSSQESLLTPRVSIWSVLDETEYHVMDSETHCHGLARPSAAGILLSRRTEESVSREGSSADVEPIRLRVHRSRFRHRVRRKLAERR